MKLIRQAFVAFLAWAVFLVAWAAVSHLTDLAGPARMTTASMGMVADALDALDPPPVLGAPQRFAATKVRSAAETAGRVHGGIERATGKFLDRLGHTRAHRHDALHAQLDGRVAFVDGLARVRAEAEGDRVGLRNARITVRANEALVRSRERRERLWLNQTQTLDSGEDVHLHVGRGDHTIWMDAGTLRPDAGTLHLGARTVFLDGANLRFEDGTLRVDARRLSAEAGRSGPQLSVQMDAGVDRDKVKKWLEKLLDLLEDLEASDTR